MKLTWAKTDVVFDGIPLFKLVERYIVLGQPIMHFELAWSEHKSGTEEVIVEV